MDQGVFVVFYEGDGGLVGWTFNLRMFPIARLQFEELAQIQTSVRHMLSLIHTWIYQSENLVFVWYSTLIFRSYLFRVQFPSLMFQIPD